MACYGSKAEAVEAGRQVRCPRCGSTPADPIDVIEFGFSWPPSVYGVGVLHCPNEMEHLP